MFSRFSLSFFHIFHIFTVLNIIYDPFLHEKTSISERNSLMTPFLLCSYFRAHQTTLLLKILGDGCMGRPPSQIFGGPSPQSPLGLRPCQEFMTVMVMHVFCDAAGCCTCIFSSLEIN